MKTKLSRRNREDHFHNLCINMTDVPVDQWSNVLKVVLKLADRTEHLRRREPDTYVDGVYVFDFTSRSTQYERQCTVELFTQLFTKIGVSATARGV